MKVRYFAWVREKTGKAEEVLDPPGNVETVAQLVTWLKGLGPEYAEAFARAGKSPPRLEPRNAGRHGEQVRRAEGAADLEPRRHVGLEPIEIRRAVRPERRDHRRIGLAEELLDVRWHRRRRHGRSLA